MPDHVLRLERALGELIRLRIELDALPATIEGPEPGLLESALMADPAAAQGLAQADHAVRRLHDEGTWSQPAAELHAGLTLVADRALLIGCWIGLLGSRTKPTGPEVLDCERGWQDAVVAMRAAIEADAGLLTLLEAVEWEHRRLLAVVRRTATSPD